VFFLAFIVKYFKGINALRGKLVSFSCWVFNKICSIFVYMFMSSESVFLKLLLIIKVFLTKPR